MRWSIGCIRIIFSTNITGISRILKTVEFFLVFTIISFFLFIKSNPVHAMEFEIDKESFVLGENYTNIIFESSNENKFSNTNTNTAIDLLIINTLIEMTENNEVSMETIIEEEPLVNHIRNMIYGNRNYSKSELIKHFSENELLNKIKKSYVYNKMVDTKIYSLKEFNKDSPAFEYEHDGRVNETTLKDLFVLSSFIFKDKEVLNNLFEQKGYYSKSKQVYIKNNLPKKLARNIKAFRIDKNENGNYDYILKNRDLTYIVKDKKDFEDACNSLIEKSPDNYRIEKEIYKEKVFNISKIPFLNKKAKACEDIYIPTNTEWKNKIILDRNYKDDKAYNKEYIGYLNIYNKEYSFFYPLKKAR